MIPRSEPLPILLLVCANNRFVCLSLISFDCSLTLDDVLSPCHTIHIHIQYILYLSMYRLLFVICDSYFYSAFDFDFYALAKLTL